MYGNLIYFLVVLVVYSVYRPVENPYLPWWICLPSGLGLLLIYRLLARAGFRRLSKSLQAGRGSPSQNYHRLLGKLSVAALFFFIADVYFLRFKDLITALPLIGDSAALSGLFGLSGFAVYLVILWREAFPFYSILFRSSLSRSRFVWSQLRFNLPIILPYLLISLAEDLIGLLPQSGLKEWLASPVGELSFFVILMGAIVLFFPLLTRTMWGLKPLPPGPRRELIESFCRRHGFKYREIMLWPLYEGEGLTAGVMGLAHRWRYILITEGLLRILDDSELEAVMGHELGHVKHHHLLLYLFIFFGYLVFTYSLFDLSLPALPGSEWLMDMLVFWDGGSGAALSLWFSLPPLLLMILYFRFVFGFFMRNFERQADLFAYKLHGSAEGLINSLEAIAYRSGQSRNLPSWHHFSVAQRVDFLERCQRDPALVRGHERKVRVMLGVYFLILIAAGLVGFQGGRAGWGDEARFRLAEGLIKAEIRRSPHSAEMHRALGDLYYQTDRFEKARSAYEKSVALNPLDAESWNNLAWTLATKKAPNSEEKDLALRAALRAATLNPAPHILDTLAEAFYINGKYREALTAIEQALEAAGPRDDLEYFLEQREKFKGALGRLAI